MEAGAGLGRVLGQLFGWLPPDAEGLGPFYLFIFNNFLFSITLDIQYKSILSYINTGTQAFLCLVFMWYLSPPF